MRYIKLTPAIDSELSLADSREFISYLSELSENGRFKLIIKSQGDSGVNLFLGVDSDNLNSMKRRIYSIKPNISITDASRSAATVANASLSRGYKLKRHYSYPLYNPEQGDDSDAVIQLMRNLAQIDHKEAIEISLTAKACDPLKAKILRKRLLNGQIPRLNNPDILGIVTKSIFTAITMGVLALRACIYVIENLIYSKVPKEHGPAIAGNIADPKTVMLLDKLYEPLYKTNLTVNIKAPSPKRSLALSKEIASALNTFARAIGYQQFSVKHGIRPPDIYSQSDLAALYNFNKGDLLSGIYNVHQFKTLPLPPELKQLKTAGDLILGTSTYQESSSDIVLKAAARQRHLYITGATGSGKSTLLANLIKQDVASGQGITLIDPHGDLAQDIVDHIPEDRLNDVIYFDPGALNSSTSINLLELRAKPGTAGYKLEADHLTESIISLFRKVFQNEEISSHRIEYILRNSIHTALLIPNSTIFTIFRLLTDSNYRLEVVRSIKDPDLTNFWRNELGRAGEYQRVKMTAGVTSKIGRFLFSEPAKRVFGQPKSNLDISNLMDQRKILICNFAKGKLGEDGSKLFATAVLTKLQLAALDRVDISPTERADHYLYVDEFQNYSPNVLIQMLSEARKYSLYLTIAEQSPSQQDTKDTNVILANVGNLLCFRTASPKDEHLLQPSFDKYLKATDLNNLPIYNFYFRSNAEEVIPPTSGRTYPTLSTDKPLSANLVAKHSKQNLRHAYLNEGMVN